ncbi:hypothetical protein [Geodermatophilus sp. URMC 63]
MGTEGQDSAAGKDIDYGAEGRLRHGLGLEDLTERSIWPSAGSDLRQAPTFPRPAAHFDAAWGSEVGRVEGYRLAAEVLVRHMIRQRGDRDFLIYPFANSWRHHFELSLKLLLDVLQRCNGKPATPVRGHDLKKLWEETRRRLETVKGIEEGAALRDADRVIGQLYSLDPDGQNFRYFKRTNGSPALQGEGPVDLLGFHEALSSVASFLSAALEVVYVEIEKREGGSKVEP